MNKPISYEEFISLAKANYTRGGDSYYECWDENTFNEYQSLFGKITKARALQMFVDNCEYEAEREAARKWMLGGSDEWETVPEEENPFEDDGHYCPSSTNRDYSPSNPWDAPGMSVKDFI